MINFLQRQPEWKNTAIIVAYDDSDGWYDHQMGPIVNQSTSKADGLTGTGQCGDGATALPGTRRGPCPGPVRLWSALAAVGDFSLCAAQLCRP